uniref:Omega-conotoxin-like ArMKLT1-02 n=1 Tax=Conus arenatus TaxID=89451 RepID=O163_CONAE|nr:RecName: Full=Omega-conotoxin-like ArMKLT1-02; Flags: Precursor [Conus arenatus]AAG60467.1 conotoxin scaffold VI/VII precursor [Conus arenatus]
MKVTCMMIVAVLFLTAWTFVTADDSISALEDLFAKAHDKMENSEASPLNERDCRALGEYCGLPYVHNSRCCSQLCGFICVPESP